MPYSILPAEDADIPALTDIICGGILQDGIQEYTAATWPGVDTPEGRAAARSRFRRLRDGLPKRSDFLKVVDDEQGTGTIVACSVCSYNAEPPKQLPGLAGDRGTTEDDREYARHLYGERNALLLRGFGRVQGPVTEIMAFFVKGSHQRKGVGALLIQHLINLDAQRGLPVVLIANPRAVGFYEKQGFLVLEDKLLDLPDKWQGKPRSRLVSMIHESK